MNRTLSDLRMPSALRPLLLAAGLLACAAFTHAQTRLIPTNAVWKCLDTGQDQGTAWRATNFDDGAWPSGPAKLGYGEGNEATVVGYGPDPANRHITTYLRHGFVLSNVGTLTNLVVRLLCDDGAVLYVNGTEALRVVMPEQGCCFGSGA